MICMLTARRLKPGAYDAFRAAWDPGDDIPADVAGRFKGIYHVRDVTDPDVVISFGLFDGTLDEVRGLQAEGGRDDQLDRVAQHVDEVLLDGAYEVVEQLTPADLGA